MYQEILQFLFPKRCNLCDVPLLLKENFLCQECYQKLSLRNHANLHDELLQTMLQQMVFIEGAHSLLYFNYNNQTRNLLHLLKYNNRPEIGYHLGKIMGQLLPQATYDYLLALPLHPKKEQKRGYNQSQKIIDGIATQMPQTIILNNVLIRTTNNKQQALDKNYDNRFENVKNIFKLNPNKMLESKHLLLVDDVITSGATIYHAILPLLAIENIKISVACLSYAH